MCDCDSFVNGISLAMTYVCLIQSSKGFEVLTNEPVLIVSRGAAEGTVNTAEVFKTEKPLVVTNSFRPR